MHEMELSEMSCTEALEELRQILDGPVEEIATRFSTFLSSSIPHCALIIFDLDHSARPVKLTGDESITSKLTLDELAKLHERISRGCSMLGDNLLGGQMRRLVVIHDRTDTLFVLVLAAPFHSANLETLTAACSLVAVSIRQQIAHSSADTHMRPHRSRIAATELTISYQRSLESIQRVLCSSELDDHQARVGAAEAATVARDQLDAMSSQDGEVLGEPVDLSNLLDREVDVLRQMMLGRQNRVIAEAIGMCEVTVTIYVANILRKLGASTRSEASAIAVGAGLLPEVERLGCVVI